MHTAVLLCYGLWHEERDDSERYRRYLQEAGEALQAGGADRVILCGGHTDPQRPEQSEAATVEAFLTEQAALTGLDVVREERSINTNQNLAYAAEHIGDNETVTILCDEARKAKVIWSALHILLDVPQQTIHALLLAHTHGDLYAPFTYDRLTVQGLRYSHSEEEILRQSYSGLLDGFALYDEAIAEQNLTQRREDFGLEG